MATINGEIDQYGFERPEDFAYDTYEEFFSEYLSILARRMSKWEKLPSEPVDITKSRKIKRYVRKGIPSELRTKIWLTISLAEQTRKQSPKKYGDYLAGTNTEKKVINSIQGDIRRTYPENIYFKEVEQNSLLEPLSNVLIAYANYNPRIGYCQGLNYVAGMLLLITKNESHSFWLLVQLLDVLVPDFYSERMFGLRVECKVLELLIQSDHPDLHEHFQQNNVDMELFASKWFVCLFMDILPVETVLRLWDCLFNEGSKILLRAAFTLIVTNKEKFLQLSDFTQLCNMFKEITRQNDALHCHTFLKRCFEVPKSFSRARITKLRQQVTGRLDVEQRR